MNLAGAAFFERLTVRPGSVSLVPIEAIFRPGDGVLTHDPITLDFGDDTGGGDRKTQRVTFDDGSMRDGKIRNRSAIDQGHISGLFERPQRAARGRRAHAARA